MIIGIIIRTKFDDQYKEIKTAKGYETIERAIVKILKKKYKNKHQIKLLNAYKLNTTVAKKCDVVWFCFEDFSNILKEQLRIVSDKVSLSRYNKTINKILSLPNLYPNPQFLRFIHDKCQYYTWLQNKKIPVSPTICADTDKYDTKEIIKTMKKWPVSVFKPVLGGESKGFQIYKRKDYKKSEVKKYFDDAKKAHYPAVIIQKYIDNFATEKYPEVRTVWVGNKFVYAANTLGWGVSENLSTKVDPKFIKLGKKVIKLLEAKFNFQLATIRIDFGKTPKEGIFINEIEYGYGTFAELNPKISEKLPKLIAERFAKIVHLD